MQISVEKRGKISGGRFPLQVTMPEGATLGMLKGGISQLVPSLSVERQRLTDANKVALLDDSKTLTELGFGEQNVVTVKDLGPQISWRTVFLVEYAGPLFIHPFLYYVSPLFWSHFGRAFEHSFVQHIVLVLVMAHFAKREFESLFIHRFSNATMPAFNIIKNSTHYWLLSGILLGCGVYSPLLGAAAVKGTIRDNHLYIWSCVALWVFAEAMNFHSHVILMNLRPKGTRVRRIPYGGAFGLVSCPNYFFEVLTWLSITMMTLSLSSLVFLVVSAAQMTIWAIKKHKNYRKEFGNQYPRQRKIMYPFIF